MTKAKTTPATSAKLGQGSKRATHLTTAALRDPSLEHGREPGVDNQTNEAAFDGRPEPAPFAPPADGWYRAALADGEQVVVAVSNSGQMFVLHRAVSGCREVPAELVAQGYFADWQALA